MFPEKLFEIHIIILKAIDKKNIAVLTMKYARLSNSAPIVKYKIIR